MSHPYRFDHGARCASATCANAEKSLLLLRIGYGLTLLASLAAFAVRVGG